MRTSRYTKDPIDGNTVPGQIDANAMLNEHNAYLVRQVKDYMHLHPGVVRPEVLDLETDELAQRVRIKFWHALEDKPIDYPKAYIRTIVRSEFIDMVRRLKPDYTLDLPVNEEGELYQGHMLINSSQGMTDPSVEYEEQVAASECLQKVVDAVITLPTRQQHALICEMYERVDDLNALTSAFKKHKTDIERWQWPQEKHEKFLLRASLAHARLKVSTQMIGTRQSKLINLVDKIRKAAC